MKVRRVGLAFPKSASPAQREAGSGRAPRLKGLQVTAIFDLYWWFAAERQAIYYRRLADPVGPWTDDLILRLYRFTNAYRVSDRVSQYLIREVQYRSDRPQSERELFFRTLLFKIFNRIETWEEIERESGPVSSDRLDLLDVVARVLDVMMQSGRRVYSAAYIMPAPNLGHRRKHRNHLALLARMMAEQLPERVANARSLRSVYESLLAYPGIGPFLAFQYAIDLNYSAMLDFDEAGFAVAGPGALDGIAKCFESTGGMRPEDVICSMVERQEIELARLGLRFQNLFGRRLQPVDCQNIFCEISKYARASHPNALGLSGRTRIKQNYHPDPKPLLRPMYPTNWKLVCSLTPRSGAPQ
jgi:alpha-glutamyl/putrescinyl thymine pyrophosphorylase clade 1